MNFAALTLAAIIAAQPVLAQVHSQAQASHVQANGTQASHPGREGRSGTVTAIATEGLKAIPFRAPDGKRGWKVKIPGGRALATPAVVDGIVFVGGGFGSHEFYAFDAETGNPRWAIRVSDDGPTAAVVADGRVVFNTESCTLFVVDARTGRQIWSRWLGDPLMSQPAVHAGVVYMAYPAQDGQHRLIALKLENGDEIFQRRIAGDIVSAPVVNGDAIYLTTTDGTVYSHALADGRLIFEKKLHATSAPFVSDGDIHLAQSEPAARAGAAKTEGFRKLSKSGEVRGGLQAERQAAYLDQNVQARSGYSTKQAHDDAAVGFGSGAPANAKTAAAKMNLGQGTVRGLWEFQGSRPTIVGNRNYATQGDALRALDKTSGKLLWEHKLSGDAEKVGGHLGSPPAYASGKLVIATTLGDIVGYAADSGKELFRVALEEEIRFQPALAHGRVYVGTAVGTLVSVDTGDKDLDGWTMWGGGPSHNGPETR